MVALARTVLFAQCTCLLLVDGKWDLGIELYLQLLKLELFIIEIVGF